MLAIIQVHVLGGSFCSSWTAWGRGLKVSSLGHWGTNLGLGIWDFSWGLIFGFRVLRFRPTALAQAWHGRYSSEIKVWGLSPRVEDWRFRGSGLTFDESPWDLGQRPPIARSKTQLWEVES